MPKSFRISFIHVIKNKSRVNIMKKAVHVIKLDYELFCLITVFAACLLSPAIEADRLYCTMAISLILSHEKHFIYDVIK